MNDIILLLNPPGATVYLREYYCSKTPKVPFTYHPVDLYYISGWLGSEYDLRVLDCIAENIGPAECLKRVSEIAPAEVVSLTGHVSWAEDLHLFKLLADQQKCDIIASGDILLDQSGGYISGDSPIKAVVLDFTTDDILHYLRKEYEKIR